MRIKFPIYRITEREILIKKKEKRKMCNFKSAIIFKNRVVLAPMYNDSHSRILENLNVEDSTVNASKMFVRAELLPNGNETIDAEKWKYKVDQDILPDWYEKDPKKYEEEFRNKVREWMKGKFEIICGRLCVKIKEDEKGTYYKTINKLFSSEFGKDNNYATSVVREKLKECDFANALKKEYEDRLVPIALDLRSLDGLDDYGCIEGDVLSLMNIDLYRECRKNIPNSDEWEWLATPDSTPSGYGSGGVRCVISIGSVRFYGCAGTAGACVRFSS